MSNCHFLWIVSNACTVHGYRFRMYLACLTTHFEIASNIAKKL